MGNNIKDEFIGMLPSEFYSHQSHVLSRNHAGCFIDT